MNRHWLAVLAVLTSLVPVASQTQDAARQFAIARAKALELNTPYVPPPGDPSS